MALLTKSLSFSYGSKRILISDDSSNFHDFSANFELRKPKEQYVCEKEDAIGSSLLEALPQEILIKVICGVLHNDLKQLFHVSKIVRYATIIAKKSHFAYTTPLKTKAFRSEMDMVNNWADIDIDYKALNAPKQSRKENCPQIIRKKLKDISVALFIDDDHSQKRSRRSLFTETNY